MHHQNPGGVLGQQLDLMLHQQHGGAHFPVQLGDDLKNTLGADGV